MKRAVLLAVLLVGALAVAGTALSTQAQNTLSPIDTVPTRPELDQVFAGSAQAQTQLIAVAENTDPSNVPFRLRAIAALGNYPGTAAHQALLDIIAATSSARSGSNLLVLRAAIETLGHLQVPSDLDTLTPLLEHPSRDIAAAAALALGNLCNTNAIPYLRTRYGEAGTVAQVKLAISEALRILGQSPSACSVN